MIPPGTLILHRDRLTPGVFVLSDTLYCFAMLRMFNTKEIDIWFYDYETVENIPYLGYCETILIYKKFHKVSSVGARKGGPQNAFKGSVGRVHWIPWGTHIMGTVGLL